MSFLKHLQSTIGLILRHPENKGRPISALCRIVWWQIRKRTFGAMTIRIAGGRLFKVMPDSKFSSLVYYTRLPDWEEMDFLLRILRDGDGFLDIGANVGFYTMLASSQIRAEHIWAFEPNPKNIEVLNDQLRLNCLSGIHVFPFALADREGTAQFAAANRETGSLSSASSSGTFQVNVRRLDDLVASVDLPPVCFAKIDVEGGEIGALRGCPDLLSSQKIKVWLLEVSAKNQRLHGHTLEELLQIFISTGYSFYRWEPQSAQLIPLGTSLPDGLANVIACHSDGEWLRTRLGNIG